MKLSHSRSMLPFVLLLAAACSGGDGGTSPTVPELTCSPGPAPTVMNPGEFRILDPDIFAGCLRLPEAGPAGAEYLVVAVSTAGQVTAGGVSVDYAMQGGLTGGASAPVAGTVVHTPAPESDEPSGSADAFHQMLRVREQALAAEPGAHLVAAPPTPSGPLVVGVRDTFQVCSNTTCTSFATVIATAKYVGPRGAIFLDNSVPAGGFVQEDIDTLGLLFDGGSSGTPPNMYEIDTTAFGRESDVDGNGKVIFLLTDAVNALSGSCSNGGSIILGFFFGGDLLARGPSNPGSNQAEIFYGLVPAPNGGCAISKDYVKRQIAPVFIHEFQHMISYNQHVLLHGGFKGEEVWLNEALSHFAEELGGRLLGNGPGQGGASSRLVQFAIPDLLNAHDYLFKPSAYYLIAPSSSTGTLQQRGAGWLFVRWLADHYAADTIGTSLTRQLVGTSLLGEANVESATGRPFSELIPLWQMANYLDNLPDFTPVDARLEYPSWDLRYVYDTLHAQRPDLVPREYPLEPDLLSTGSYSQTGTLRGGSGRHLRVVQGANAGAVDVILARQNGEAFPDDRGVRLGVVRIR